MAPDWNGKLPQVDQIIRSPIRDIHFSALHVYARRVASPLPTQEALVYAEHMARLQLALNRLKARP